MRLERSSAQRPSPALIVAMIALVAALAGTAIAAGPPTKPISKSKVKRIAAKQVKKLAPGLSVANAATAGSAATAGRADTAGRAENVLWAVVADDDPPFAASLVRAGQPDTTVTEASPDGVIVDFGRPVTNCAWIATKGAPDSGSPGLPGGGATTEGVAGNPSGVQVEVRTSGGAFLDDPFHLLVIC